MSLEHSKHGDMLWDSTVSTDRRTGTSAGWYLPFVALFSASQVFFRWFVAPRTTSETRVRTKAQVKAETVDVHSRETATPSVTTVRLSEIDLCRGFLVALMTNTHALSLAGVPADSFWWSDGWLPNGWATQCFIVLSGYAVGVLYTSDPTARRGGRRLLQRAGQIFVVMFVSNIFFLLAQLTAHGALTDAWDIFWWIGLITFATPYSISAILLPTAVLLCLAPRLLHFASTQLWLYFVVTAVGSLMTAVASVYLLVSKTDSHLLGILLTTGIGGFPVLPFVLYGAVGIGLGRLLLVSPASHWCLCGCLALAQSALYLWSTESSGLVLAMVTRTLTAPGKFAWVFLVAFWVCRSSFGGCVRWLELLGRFALGAFVLHRVFLHVFYGVVSGSPLLVSSQSRYVVLVSATLLATWGVMMLRQRYEAIDRTLKRGYL
ncbi:MAG: acyltransferase family protein [Candidatus Binatia bacterium]